MSPLLLHPWIYEESGVLELTMTQTLSLDVLLRRLSFHYSQDHTIIQCLRKIYPQYNKTIPYTHTYWTIILQHQAYVYPNESPRTLDRSTNWRIDDFEWLLAVKIALRIPWRDRTVKKKSWTRLTENHEKNSHSEKRRQYAPSGHTFVPV